VDYEGELAVVIGRQARTLRADTDLRPYIRGYTIVNDVTARDLQKSDGHWTRAKGFDTFCPCGPIISSEVNPSAGLMVETRLNGERKQRGTTRDFLFLIPHLLVYITAFMTLEPGDLIPTGTPAGVGPMSAGDTVEVEIDGLGILRNSVA
jgi:2-keto-4-pentenoate hydratase/2-oxohepta-3-ene-1,7-dioic acid hydratase in catechol pathway